MSNANPYSLADTKLSVSPSELTPTRLLIRHLFLYVPSFVVGCIVGTEIAWNWLICETLWAESLFLQQSLAIFEENLAAWLIASLVIAILTFVVFPPRTMLGVFTRGTICGFVFAIPMLGTGWLATYLAQRGIGLPGVLSPDSLLLRYLYYAALTVGFDLLACLLFNCGLRRAKRCTSAAK